MEIQNLPMFSELSSVLCSYKIESWQAKDFWEKVKLLKVENNNVNYQSIYRLLHRLVKEDYLTIDTEKNKYGQTTYSEIEKLQEFRITFSNKLYSPIKDLNFRKENLINEIKTFQEELKVLDNLKEIYPQLEIKIEQLKQNKIEIYRSIKVQIKVLSSLIESI